MAERRGHTWRATLAGVALVLSGAFPALGAGLDELSELRMRLDSLDHMLRTQPEARGWPLDDLLARNQLQALVPQQAAGALEAPRRPGDLPQGTAGVELEDFRVALTLMSQAQDGADNSDVLMAQGERGAQALSFRGGTVTLADIRAALSRFAPGTDAGFGEAVVRRPVVLWEDTELRLGAGDRLALSREDGAFILSFGRVTIEGAEIAATETPNPHNSDFTPFLTVAGGGALRMRGATVRGMGFGKSEKFAGVSVLTHPFMPPIGPSRIEDSHFDNIVTLVVSGTAGAVVRNNRFHDVRDNALRLTRAPRASVTHNLFYGGAPTNAIRLLDRSDNAIIAGNIFLRGERAGILVRDGSDRAEVTDNVIWRRDGGGIKFLRAPCGLAARNILLDGRQKGIEIRESPRATLSRNLIGGGRSSAIWISGQPDGSITRIFDNIVTGNAIGLATATAARVWMAGNDLTGQLPRLVDGDMTLQNAALIGDLQGLRPVELTAAGSAIETEMTASTCHGGDT